jgi:hypothetical protein
VKRALVVFAIGGGALFAPGCGHTETHQAMLRAPAERTGGAVELYMADQPIPQRPYSEIALVQAIGFGSDAHPEDVARALTEKAGSLGCDAVLRTFVDVGYSRAHAAGVCVKWLGPPTGPAVARPGPGTGLPPDPGSNPPPPPMRPAPSPKIEPLPSAPNRSGGGF